MRHALGSFPCLGPRLDHDPLCGRPSPRPQNRVCHVHAVPWPEPDPQVVAAVRAMYGGKKRPPLAVTVRDRLGEWLHDEDFAGVFGTRGRPGWSPSRLALVTVLQMAGDLDDRAADDP
jgi:hypothetical protein